jgi:hypothetical protein
MEAVSYQTSQVDVPRIACEAGWQRRGLCAAAESSAGAAETDLALLRQPLLLLLLLPVLGTTGIALLFPVLRWVLNTHCFQVRRSAASVSTRATTTSDGRRRVHTCASSCPVLLLTPPPAPPPCTHAPRAHTPAAAGAPRAAANLEAEHRQRHARPQAAGGGKVFGELLEGVWRVGRHTAALASWVQQPEPQRMSCESVCVGQQRCSSTHPTR